MFIQDPGFGLLSVTDPGSLVHQQKRGGKEKKILVLHFIGATNFTKWKLIPDPGYRMDPGVKTAQDPRSATLSAFISWGVPTDSNY
jgi:hypothetical protein